MGQKNNKKEIDKSKKKKKRIAEKLIQAVNNRNQFLKKLKSYLLDNY